MTDRRRPATSALLALFGFFVCASLVSSFHIPIAGRRVRPEHLAAGLACVAFIVLQLRARVVPLRIDAVALLAVGWVLVNALSSWLYAPDRGESFVHVLRFGLLATGFMMVANLPLRAPGDWERAFRLWLGLGTLALFYGLIVWLLATYADVWWPGATREEALTTVSVNGTQFERNLYGILAASLLASAVYVLCSNRLGRGGAVAGSRMLGTVIVISTAAVVVSMTRSAWLAALLAAPLTYLLLERRRVQTGDRALLHTAAVVPILIGSLIGLVRIVPALSNPAEAPAAAAEAPVVGAAPESPAGRQVPAAPQLPAAPPVQTPSPPSVEQRLATLNRLDEDFTVSTRIQDAQWALADWKQSPWLGWGTGSFSQLHGDRRGTRAWVSNLVLHTLVDTGLLGLAIQLGLIAMVALRGWRAAAVTVDVGLRVGLRALVISLMLMLIAYQSTNGSWMATFWIHLGLIANGTRLAGQRRD